MPAAMSSGICAQAVPTRINVATMVVMSRDDRLFNMNFRLEWDERDAHYHPRSGSAAMMLRHAMLLALIWPALADAESLRRASVWDLKLGEPIAAQPAADEFRAFACGSNGGAPRAQLKGFGDFMRCPAEADGLREVYFEYDDELEYIARARDLEREITRWAGTTELGFPVIVSALFGDAGILKGIRLDTEPST